jgi:hypothetical protein
MTTYNGGFFDNGFLPKLLSVSAGLGGPSSADRELDVARLCRSIQRGPGSPWSLPLATVSAAVDLVAEVLESPLRSRLPDGFEKSLEFAAGGRPSTEFLADLALVVRQIDMRGVPDYEQVPLAPWEITLTFPEVIDFTYWVETDEYETLDECIWAGFDSLHPTDCASKATGLVAQAQELLILFPEADALRSALAPKIPWISRSILQEIILGGQRHFSEFHSDAHSEY